MPAELALLPVVESAFDPFATSPAGAAGIWQFMPETADHVGLDMDWWYDGRRDIVASTEAALAYLGDLHERFDGDWLLALAAYNAGSARVQRAIARNRAAGEPADYWHLPLPAETRAYVPRLIALKTIIARPHDYGVSLPELPDAAHFSVVEIDGQIDLRVAARLAGTSLDGLRRLNPGYDRQITAPHGTHTLLIPTATAQLFRERIARLPAERRIESIRYRIRPGDNLSTLALVYNTTVKALRRTNRLRDNRIVAGELLIVPAPGADALVANNDYEGLL
jgi:membrane-bound lytic murein transglycosylase D